MARKTELAEEIKKGIEEIEDEVLRAFLALYWERGHYARTVQVGELNKTLEAWGFREIGIPTRQMLSKALQVAKAINSYSRY